MHGTPIQIEIELRNSQTLHSNQSTGKLPWEGRVLDVFLAVLSPQVTVKMRCERMFDP